MPASISLVDLCWSTPDGTPLFTDLNLAFGHGCTGIVGRNGSGKTSLLRLISGDLRPASGSVQISGSIAIMRQDALAHPDDTIADMFGVRAALDLLNRAEAGLAKACELAEADWTLPARIERALLRCGLSAGPMTPLATLSGGQRSRAALASLIFAEPDFLLLDEPTNNLDREGRTAVRDLLQSWNGGAIIVSHDRQLLEEMDAIVELTSLGVTRYGGNYSAFQQRKNIDLEAAARNLTHAKKTSSEAALRAQQAHERKARKDRVGRQARAKRDQPKILMDFAKGRAEASHGAGSRLRDARREMAAEAVTEAKEKIEILQPLQMGIAPTGLTAGKKVLRLEGVTGGYCFDHPLIRDLSLTVTGPERLLISGANGSGKTTLLKIITGQLSPQSGTVEVAAPYALLDQHVSMLDPSLTLLDNFRRINPAADTHMAHAALARFGFRATDALQYAGEISGGERLRAGLACTFGATPPPQLLILDEPTNHLDLEGITALEAALAVYDGAVLAISHDAAFVDSLSPDRTICLG